MTATPCSDCIRFHHQKCQGDTWDLDSDQPAVCSCWIEGHHPWPYTNMGGTARVHGVYDDEQANQAKEAL